jgi:hypothetical protein
MKVRFPRGIQPCVGHLREKQIGDFDDAQCALGRATTVVLPVPECEHDCVGEPDLGATEQQSDRCYMPTGGDHVHQQADRHTVRNRDQAQQDLGRQPLGRSPTRHPLRVHRDENDQRDELDALQEELRMNGEPRRQRRLQADSDQDRRRNPPALLALGPPQPRRTVGRVDRTGESGLRIVRQFRGHIGILFPAGSVTREERGPINWRLGTCTTT